MPREQTDLACSPFKRLAQLAVVGLALAGLASCGGGGGGGSSPPTPPPATKVTPLVQYGSIAFNSSSSSWGIAGIARSTTSSAARTSAVSFCGGAGCQQVLHFRNACGSLAKSTDNTRAGVGWDRSAEAAEQEAIAACREAGGQGCSVSTLRSGGPFTVCAQAGTATPTGQASTIPPRPSASPTPQPQPDPQPQPVRELPSVYTPRNAPQASGTDISTIEISGLGSLSRFAVSNSGSTPVSIRAGTWYEPRDGSFQRMIVTRTTSVPPRRVEDVPIACMQQSKSIPAIGLRFFSSPKAITGSVQQCQQGCLSRAIGDIQQCVWACESERPTSLTWSVEDGCNDGRNVEYRFYEQRNGAGTGRHWPGGNNLYVTSGFDRTIEHSGLACGPGISICLGGEIDGTRASFGVGLDGTEGCTGCCYPCGATTRVFRFGCPR